MAELVGPAQHFGVRISAWEKPAQTARGKGMIYERFFENFLVAAKKT